MKAEARAQKKSNEMSIKTIPRAEFARLQPLHAALESLMGEQVECFSNRSENLLGFVAKSEGIAGWNYVILKRDKAGEYHARKVMGNFFSLKDARVDLLLLIAGIEKFDGANWEAAVFGLPSIPVELFAVNHER
jgi:hypothetical protein